MGNYILCHSNTSGWAIGGELYHHGILGQKWGVRRYQNADGTLTSAGKKRYGSEERKNILDEADGPISRFLIGRHVDNHGKLDAKTYNRYKKIYKNGDDKWDFINDPASSFAFANSLTYQTGRPVHVRESVNLRDIYGPTRHNEVLTSKSTKEFRNEYGEDAYREAFNRAKSVFGDEESAIYSFMSVDHPNWDDGQLMSHVRDRKYARVYYPKKED